jgi:TolA-binding protein
MAVFFGQFQRALTIYEQVYQRHPDSDIGGNALFMKGFTLDNHLNDYESAGQAYRSFLEEFPNHNLLPSASFLLENLGKSEEEIISSFKQEG